MRALTDERGVAAIEFVMLAPMFIALLLASTVVGVGYLAKSELDYATQRVARLVMTRQVTTSTALQTQLCNSIGGIFDCNQLMINLTSVSSLSQVNASSPSLTYNSQGSVSNSWSSNFGSVGSIMVLQVMYQFPMLSTSLFNFNNQSNSSNLMISTAVFVNE